jgi:hypothetical protein
MEHQKLWIRWRRIRFTPVDEGAQKKGYKRCPSRRNGGTHGRHRIGAGLPTRISPDPQKNHAPDAPSHSTKFAAHQFAPPRSCNHHRCLTLTKVMRPTGMKMGIREQRTAEQRTRKRARPDATGADQALLARPSPRAHEAPITALQ